MPFITIDTSKITDWASFHQVFADALGFPDYYGRNMDAWIDCMSDIHDGESQCNVRVAQGEMLHLLITNTVNFYERQPKIMQELVECTSLVNARFVECEGNAKLSLVFVEAPSNLSRGY